MPGIVSLFSDFGKLSGVVPLFPVSGVGAVGVSPFHSQLEYGGFVVSITVSKSHLADLAMSFSSCARAFASSFVIHNSSSIFRRSIICA